MSGEMQFGSSMFGFNKTDVNNYIEKILREFEDKLKEKDVELAGLKGQLKDLKAKYDELQKRSDQVNEDRAKIAEVLIKAQEKAELMLTDAKQQALDEKRELEIMVEKEREKLVDARQELKNTRDAAVNLLKRFEVQLDDMVKPDDN